VPTVSHDGVIQSKRRTCHTAPPFVHSGNYLDENFTKSKNVFFSAKLYAEMFVSFLSIFLKYSNLEYRDQHRKTEVIQICNFILNPPSLSYEQFHLMVLFINGVLCAFLLIMFAKY
jgi:hypothetical protein